MALIYIAGLVSGILLVAIALAGWIRKAGKELKGGVNHQTPVRKSGTIRTTDTSKAPVARHRSHGHRRPDSAVTGFA